MSTASLVPETWELTGDDARHVLKDCGRGTLLKDAFMRLRVADGFSHARSLAYVTALVFVQGIIGLIGLAVAIGDSIDSPVLNRTWQIARWPIAVALVTLAIAMLFRWSPRRHQPAPSWLAFAAAVAAAGWLAVTAGLSLRFAWSKSFGQTYGPLAGMVALLLWSLLAAVALLYGGAVGAQLEAVRAGRQKPQDGEKVEHAEPDSQGDRRPAGVAS